jgi:ESCRT-II complex subunit VPS36
VLQLPSATDFLAYQSALLSTTSSLINPPAPGYLRLSFLKQDALTLLLNSLQSALTAKSWTAASSPSSTSPASATSPSVPSKRSFSTTSAGVSGIIRDVDASSRRTDAQLDAAFADLTALSKHALAVMELAEKFSRQVQASGSGSEEEAALTSLLTSMGLPSPVTRNSVPASSFHLQLARQLSDFIAAHPRFRSAQMLTLTDVYCLYNRARGTELISPADCLKACQLMGAAGGAGGSLAMHKLDSGLLVLCRPGLVERGVEDVLRVVTEREGGDGVSLLALSAALGLSVLLLEERCRLAERKGLLVRDESVEGIKWFDNRFDKWTQDTASAQ